MTDGDRKVERFSKEKQEHVKTILVVKDNADVGAFIVEALTGETTHRALLATNGTEAQEILKTLVPDLFVLDYHLPQINELEFADRLHATEHLKDVLPVLLALSCASLLIFDRSRHVCYATQDTHALSASKQGRAHPKEDAMQQDNPTHWSDSGKTPSATLLSVQHKGGVTHETLKCSLMDLGSFPIGTRSVSLAWEEMTLAQRPKHHPALLAPLPSSVLLPGPCEQEATGDARRKDAPDGC